MDMICNTFLQKRDSRLITYSSGGNQSQIDYILTKKDDRKLISDVKVIPGEECALQLCALQEKIAPKRKIWKLKEYDTQQTFVTELQNCLVYNPESSVEEKWVALEKALLNATDKSCGWTKRPRHKVTWWRSSDVDLVIKEKRRLWKIWESGGSKEGYLEAKRVAKKKVYVAKKKAEEVQFANVASDKKDRNQLFKIARQMVKTNADVVGDKCVTNDDGELVCTDSEKLFTWKQHYEKLLNEEFPWEEEHLVHQEHCQGPHPKIEREWVKVSLQKMKNGKAVGTSDIAAEMLKAAGDIGLDIQTDLCNTIIQENSIPSRWDASIILELL